MLFQNIFSLLKGGLTKKFWTKDPNSFLKIQNAGFSRFLLLSDVLREEQKLRQKV